MQYIDQRMATTFLLHHPGLIGIYVDSLIYWHALSPQLSCVDRFPLQLSFCFVPAKLKSSCPFQDQFRGLRLLASILICPLSTTLLKGSSECAGQRTYQKKSYSSSLSCIRLLVTISYAYLSFCPFCSLNNNLLLNII